MNAVQIASQFYVARDALRRLLGSKFDTSNGRYRRALEGRMIQLKLSVMEAALHLLKEIDEKVTDIQDQQVAKLHTMAAAVELIECKSKSNN